MAEFLTVDIKTLFNKQKTTTNIPEATTNTPNTTTPKPNDFDWGGELKRRLDNNKKLSAESREKEIDIKNTFWREYFTANWKNPVVADQLFNMGEQLRNAIVVLGFKKNTNPILAFLKLNYVQKHLISTKLLNVITFKVIYEAVAKRLIADSELRDKNKNNDYNIIYCRDFYQKQTTEMLSYLKLQKEILPSNSTSYTPEAIEKNKTVFLQSNVKNVKLTSAKLKPIKDIKNLLGIKGSKDKSVENAENTNATETELINFVTKLTSFAQIQATLQYIGMTAKGDAAKKALSTVVYSGSAEELVAAAKAIIEPISKLKLSAQNIDKLLDLLQQQTKKIK